VALARDAGWPEPLGWAFSAAKLVLLPGARQSGYIFCGLPRALLRGSRRGIEARSRLVS